VNGRDLTTLEVDRSIHAELAESVTAGRPAVAESGLLREDDIRAVAGLGYRAALVGSALMRANDPRHAVEAMVAAGRETIGAGAV
jgi:indole-3-glycerol phosphate synthase